MRKSASALAIAGIVVACGGRALEDGSRADAGSTPAPAPPMAPPDAAPTAPPHRAPSLDYPRVPAPAITEVTCGSAESFSCEKTIRGALPGTVGDCGYGFYLEARDGAPTLCVYSGPLHGVDAGPFVWAKDLSWSCFSGLPVGVKVSFVGEWSSSSGTFWVRFDGPDPRDAGAGPPTSFEVGGCFDTSSGTARCASPDTPIATPEGERPIDALAPGDLVFSSDGRSFRAVPVARVVRVPVTSHQVVRVTLDDGRSIAMSAGHPTADGRTLGDLRSGDGIDGRRVRDVEIVPYAHPYTVDILPASRSGTYVAAGVLVGSTLAPARR
jgi:hypothetical protein